MRKQKTKSQQLGRDFPPLIKPNSLPTRFVLEDLAFSPEFEKSLIRTKFETFLSKATFDPFDFESFSPFSETFESKIDTEVWSNFHKLKGLVDKFQETSEKAYFQYQQQTFSTSSTSSSHTVTPFFPPFIPSLPLQTFIQSTPQFTSLPPPSLPWQDFLH